MSDAIDRLAYLLENELPGPKAQRTLSPVLSEYDRYNQPADDARQAAVLALFYPDDADGNNLVLIKRPDHPSDLHAGQISFPGGGIEQDDKSLIDCALRETQEEIGIPQEKINVIGPLTPLYVYASNNMVYPYVGFMVEKPSVVIDPKEVAEVITCPISYFCKPESIRRMDMSIRGYRMRQVPYYDVSGHVLWGATAMIISELSSIWNQL